MSWLGLYRWSGAVSVVVLLAHRITLSPPHRANLSAAQTTPAVYSPPTLHGNHASYGPYHVHVIRRIIPTEFLSRANSRFLHEARADEGRVTPDKSGLSKSTPNRPAGPDWGAIVWADRFPNQPASKIG
jgi:hypothetical protein